MSIGDQMFLWCILWVSAYELRKYKKGVAHGAWGVGRGAWGVGRRALGVGRRASGVGRRASGVMKTSVDCFVQPQGPSGDLVAGMV